MDPKITPYSVLGVAEDASDEVIRAAHKALIFKHHPDRNPGYAEEATAKLVLLNQAFDCLSSPEARQATDAKLKEMRSPPVVATPASAAAPAKRTASAPRKSSGSPGVVVTIVVLVAAVFLKAELRDLLFPEPPAPQSRPVAASSPEPARPSGVAAIQVDLGWDPITCSDATPFFARLTNHGSSVLKSVSFGISGRLQGHSSDLFAKANARDRVIESDAVVYPDRSQTLCMQTPRPLRGVTDMVYLTAQVSDAKFYGPNEAPIAP